MVLGRVRDRLRQRRKGEKVRIAFTLDCCDREAISSVATTGGIDSSDIRDLMIESVEHRFGLVDKLPNPSSGYRTMARPIIAEETRALARDIGLVSCTTPIQSPESFTARTVQVM
jgi:putative transposase